MPRNAYSPDDASDLPLFAKPAKEDPAKELDRVSGRIASTVLEFCTRRLASPTPTFHMSELHTFVQTWHPGAPGSPDRVLRDLRRRGLVAYEVESRSESLYRLMPANQEK